MMSHSTPSTKDIFAHEQYRIYKLQVFNWGTFSNLHDIPISERGFLFVGRSGAGKSTLLDAFSALLIPTKWIDFNAAAREADRSGRDRNLVSYIRGAWSEQKDQDSGQVATQYLRTGTTWSALALSYRNALGQVVVLVQLFWLRGSSNNNADVRRHYLIFERPFDLCELQQFDFNVRQLKILFPDAAAFDEFRPYSERFRRLLGIENEMALRLLHKTQSAKNLGDLNAFLRDFMLDKPATFEVAERLVDEFSELNAAHQSVITAREQMQILLPAREEHQCLQTQHQEKNKMEEFRLGIDGYRENYRKILLERKIKTLSVEVEGLAGEIQSRENSLINQRTSLKDLEQQHRDMGGDRIAQWETELETLKIQLTERLRKKDQAMEACRKLGWMLPDSPHGFSELIGKARQELEDSGQHIKATRDKQFELVRQKIAVEEKFIAIKKEIQILKQQPSNIPAGMIELRNMLATELGLHGSALPFIGELIEVRAQEAVWQSAIERVLHGFALSLLVEESYYARVVAHVNSTHLGKRLVYYRMGQTEVHMTKPITVNSLINKLSIKDGKYHDWLSTELKQRFDYVCAENANVFKNADKAITREGLVKHGKSRHEKDDRHRIDDRTRWVLGFDNREKLALYEQQAQELANTLSSLTREIENLSEKDRLRANRELQCQIIANMQWQEIDTAPLVDRIAFLEQQFKEALNGNTALQLITQRIEQQKILIEQVEAELRDIKVKQAAVAKQISDAQKQLDNLQKTLLSMSLTPFQRQALADYFTAVPQKITIDNLDDVSRNVERKIGRELETINSQLNQLEHTIKERFAEFKRRWPMDASDMDANIESAADFFAKLQRIEIDGLPAYEHRFSDLLKKQSDQNLAALSTHLNHARKSIAERMELVNESLGQAPFNPGTYLYIDVIDRQLPEVREFKQQLQQSLFYAWKDDRENAETRFAILHDLVEKLSGQEADKKRWRESVLDVRMHVEFIGRECDRDGNEIEIHRSGAGKSGGQRQKLATTCLAAALRYQLGGSDHHAPLYAPVILDEAFDKADNEFTTLAMNIFTNFGFQMIVATPLKSVMTLEPFIGGACFVDISERRHSGVFLIEYDVNGQRLNLPEEKHDASVALS